MLVLGTLAVASRGRPVGLHPRRTPASRCFRHHLCDVVRAEDRDRRRRADAPRRCAAPSAAPRGSSPASSSRRYSSSCWSPIMWFGHTVFLAGLAVRPRDRLDRTGARRPLRSAGRRDRAISGRRPLLGVALARDPGSDASGAPFRIALLHRGRTRAVDPARGRHRRRRSSARAGAHRHRPAAGRDAPPPALRCAGAAGAAQRRARGLTPCSRDCEPHAASSARCASITATAQPRDGDGPRSTASSSSRGDLVFDIGAHVGDRVARVPPPRRARGRGRAAAGAGATLQLLYGRDRNVAIEPVAVGAATGRSTCSINVDNPTVSTASAAFVDAADGAPGWEGQRWTQDDPRAGDDARRADRAARHAGLHQDRRRGLRGRGACRPDAGRSTALSFEFTTIQRDVALACVDALRRARLHALQRRARREPDAGACRLGHAAADRALAPSLPHDANSGDIYAVRE